MTNESKTYLKKRITINYLNFSPLSKIKNSISFILFNAIMFSLLSYHQDAKAQSTTSGNVECMIPSTITIDKFTSGKDLKVVIGNKINYKSKGDKTLPIHWKMGKYKDGVYSDTLIFSTDTALTIPPIWKEKGDVYISKSQLPTSNDDFGLTRGNVYVQTGATPIIKDDEQVKVFFNKNDRCIHDPLVPNWFYYWKQSPIIQNLLSIPGFTLYDETTCSFKSNPTPITLNLQFIIGSVYNPTGSNEYGFCKFGSGNMAKYEPYPKCDKVTDPPRTVLSNYTNSSNTSTSIFIGEGCGFEKTMKDGTILQGIHVLYSTIIHEREHAIIECENWEKDSLAIDVGKGYSSLWDLDRDGYKDVWELSHSPIFGIEGFGGYTKKDAYGLDISGIPTSYDSSKLGMGIYSAGTEYEESRCRQVELNSKSLFNLINQYDWSFDKSKIIQGKQW